MATKQSASTYTFIPHMLIIGGALGLASAFVIMYEKLHILSDPSYDPSCSINPIISCGSVMMSKQAGVFGFPNPLIGLAAFSVLITIGVALLAGAQFKRWFWRGLQAGTVLGLIFIHWLFYQSVYTIGALCLYCMVVWAATFTIFWYTTLHNLQTKVLPTPKRLRSVVTFAQRHHVDILVVWVLAIAGLILQHFWYYWKTVL